MGILKLGGIASGLDTESLIKSLMTLERRPEMQLQQRSDTLTSQANAWRDLNTRLLTLQKRLEDIKNIAAADWDGKKATPSDATVLTATAQSTAVAGTYSVEVVALAKATVWQQGVMNDGTNATPVTDPAAALNISGQLKVVSSGTNNGKTININATDSLNSIASNINSQKDTLGFSASVVQVNPGDYRLVLTGNTGAANDFALVDGMMADGVTPSTAGAQLKLTATDGFQVGMAANATAKVNGVSVASSSNTFSNVVTGTTFTALKVGTTSVTVSEDNSKVTSAVKSFVDQYNSVVDFIGQLTSYDTKTKQAGTLLGEDRVTSIQQSLRSNLLDPVKDMAAEVQTLGIVGISTDSFTSGQTMTGHLSFDQTKFEAALDKNPSGMRDLFTKNTTDSQGKVVQGIAVRTAAWLDNYTKTGGILLGQATEIDGEVKRLKDRIKVWDEQILPMREQRLREQFTNLEKVMSTFQNQGNWLSQQLKGLPSGQ